MLNRLLAVTYSKLERAYWTRTYERYRRVHDIDPSFRFAHGSFEITGDGRVAIGANGHASTTRIYACEGTTVTLGANVAIASNVTIRTQSGRAGHTTVGSVAIGDNVWICVNAYIGPGVTIGDNAIIGANTVVTSSVPANTIMRWAADRSGSGFVVSQRPDG